jgi:hypothetical protein
MSGNGKSQETKIEEATPSTPGALVVHESPSADALAIVPGDAQGVILSRNTIQALEETRAMVKFILDLIEECDDPKQFISKIPDKRNKEDRPYPRHPLINAIMTVLGLTVICTKLEQDMNYMGIDGTKPRRKFIAGGDIIHVPTGQKIGYVEMDCAEDEEVNSYGKTRADWDDYALKSFAQTRMESKAGRLKIGFLLPLAGLNPTPWEEMESIRSQQRAENQGKGGKKKAAPEPKPTPEPVPPRAQGLKVFHGLWSGILKLVAYEHEEGSPDPLPAMKRAFILGITKGAKKSIGHLSAEALDTVNRKLRSSREDMVAWLGNNGEGGWRAALEKYEPGNEFQIVVPTAEEIESEILEKSRTKATVVVRGIVYASTTKKPRDKDVMAAKTIALFRRMTSDRHEGPETMGVDELIAFTDALPGAGGLRQWLQGDEWKQLDGS